MIGLLQSESALSSIKYCIKHFKRENWNASPSGQIPHDIRITKDIFKFNIEIVDKSALHVKSPEAIYSDISQHYRYALHNSIPLIFVFNFSISDYLLSELQNDRVLFFDVEEMDLISKIDAVMKSREKEIAPRQLLLLESSPWLCLSYSDFWEHGGDVELATEWATKALRYSRNAPVISRSVANKLIKANKYEAAYQVAYEAAIRNKYDLGLLKILLEISIKTKNYQNQDYWQKQISEMGGSSDTGHTSNIDRILKLPPRAAPIENVIEDAPSNVRRSLRNLFSRFRR